VRFIAIKGIKDTQCGFKCFKREAIPTIFARQTIDGFGFDVELLWIASKRGYLTKEVPVQWFNDSNSRVNPLTDGICMLYELLKIRINDLMGKYR
jgi:dolichyl-phosphate beta-glucosyltransferase